MYNKTSFLKTDQSIVFVVHLTHIFIQTCGSLFQDFVLCQRHLLAMTKQHSPQEEVSLYLKLISILTGLDSVASVHSINIFSCFVKSNPVKPETSRTMILRPKVPMRCLSQISLTCISIDVGLTLLLMTLYYIWALRVC